MAQGRHGELIVVQGGGVRPARWGGAGVAIDAGMSAPTAKPSITDITAPQYYVARVDITKPGACYYAPPEVALSTDSPPDSLTGRVAKAASYLSQSSVSEIRVLDGGKGYGDSPTVVLSDSHGKGGVIEALLDAPEELDLDPTNSVKTGITVWDVVSGPPFEDELDLVPVFKTKWLALGPVTIPIANGSGRIQKTLWYSQPGCFPIAPAYYIVTIDIPYTISGVKNGAGASLRVGFSGHIAPTGGGCTLVNQFVCSCVWNDWLYSSGVSGVTPSKYGANYADDETITVTIPASSSWDGETQKYIPAPASKALVIRGYSANNPLNPGGQRYPVKSLKLIEGGDGYVVAPQLKIVSNSGFGAYGTCAVAEGKIVSVKLENSGGGYKAPPTVEILSGGAEAFAVARPHLRGTYQCYYRFVDDTPEDKGGPIPSNLSPVTEIDTGAGASSITWNPPAPTGRAKKVELWRTTGDQAITLYRVATVTATFVDDLTDEELRDADRKDYAAMPIVLPNGAVNANRFGVPPSDKAVVVRFQDRHWYGVDTSGKQPNTIYYSEVDEPESVPDSNEIILQQNARDSDSLRAMIPFGSTLLLMQERHSFSLTFAKTPLLDAQVTPIAFRGCINQRCWDIYDGVCYVADQYGVYAIQPTGQIENLSDAIADQFRDKIDFAKSTWAFLLVDPKSKILRFFAAFKDDSSGGYPSRALCYSIDMKSWWFEKYPQRISGGTQVRLSNGDFRCAYAAESGPVLLNEGMADIGRGAVTKVTLTNGGTGYRTPPKVTASGGCGAEFQASINNSGKVTAIWIVSPGYGYASGSLVISPPDDPNTSSPVRAVATYEATSKTADASLFTSYRYKSGAAAYVTDADDPKAASAMSRSIGLSYQPQSKRSVVSLRTYYNNSTFPRGNVAPRDRGTGFVHDTVDNAARRDMEAQQTSVGYETGVATAMFSGRSLDDIRSSDRHIAVELVGARTAPDPVTIYEISLDGVAGK